MCSQCVVMSSINCRLCVCSVCLTDQASCGCCLMQQQIHRMKLFFNESLNELEKELTNTKNVLNSVRGETVKLPKPKETRVLKHSQEQNFSPHTSNICRAAQS